MGNLNPKYKPLYRGSDGFIYRNWDKYLDAEARHRLAAASVEEEIERRAQEMRDAWKKHYN